MLMTVFVGMLLRIVLLVRPARFMIMVAMFAMMSAATGNVVQFVLSQITHCVLALRSKLERVAPTFD
jgi:hypothetical protein